MLIAAIGDTPYNIVLFLHILSAFVAFAPAFVHPFIGEQSKAVDGSSRAMVFGFLVKNDRRVYAPALILTGLLGFGLPSLSEDDSGIAVYEFSDGWIIAAIVIWIAMNGVLHAVVVPGERVVAEGGAAGEVEAAEKRVAAGGAAVTLLLLVALYLMVFQPGA
ncbi:MAG: hypothetical protein OES57_05450 [Acidimicrobiia bacterium]|nr:hypothetical protein [Acidimicrobiia bacterium]